MTTLTRGDQQRWALAVIGAVRGREVLVAGSGGAGRTIGAVPGRGAIIEFRGGGWGGARVWWIDPTPAANPPGKSAWQPMEFLATVDATGLVGPLAITGRSGV